MTGGRQNPALDLGDRGGLYRSMRRLSEQEIKGFASIRGSIRSGNRGAKHLTTGGNAVTIVDDIPAKPLPGNR